MNPTALEIENGNKVLEILNELNIPCDIKREDIFVVTEEETGLSIVVDAEESTICLIMDVCELDLAHFTPNLLTTLLLANNKSAHGAFCIDNNKLLIKDNLEAENLDPNELAASLTSIFVLAAQNIDDIERLMEVAA